MNQFFGKYRGKVTGNKDPDKPGRIQVEVPSILAHVKKNWAMPCVPYAGKGVGFYAIPPVGANVWVEFEGGDPNYPIWSGCFWGEGELPEMATEPEVKLFKSKGITLMMNDMGDKKGQFSITVGEPVVEQEQSLKLLMDAKGIELNHDKQRSIKLTNDAIELVNNENMRVNVTAEEIELISDAIQVNLFSKDKKIELQNGSSSAVFSSDNIEIKQGNAVIKLSSSGIELVLNPATIKLSTSGIDASSGPANLNMSKSQLELSHGSGNIKIASKRVNINKGALEVT